MLLAPARCVVCQLTLVPSELSTPLGVCDWYVVIVSYPEQAPDHAFVCDVLLTNNAIQCGLLLHLESTMTIT